MVFIPEQQQHAGPAPSAPMQPDDISCVKLNTISEFTEVNAKDDKEMLALAEIQGPAEEEKKERPALSVTAVVDKSGSMSGQKLQLIQKTLSFVLTQLNPADSMGVVSYDDRVKEEIAVTHATVDGKDKIEKAVHSIHVGGCTNLSGGLLEGIRQQTAEAPAAAPAWWDVVKDTQGKIQLEVGNTHEDGVAGKHQWTLFVRAVGADTGKLVKQVDFNVPTCTPPSMVVDETPFEVMRVSEQPCTVRARVTLVDGSVKTFTHDVSFAQPETCTTYAATLKQPEQPTEVVRSVWLFTDGLANRGETKTPQILQAMAKQLGSKSVTVFSFGYGSDHNPDMLRAISEHGHGMYSYIPDQEAIPGAFAECLGGLLSVVAKDVQMTFTPQPGCQILKVYTPFDQKTVDSSVVVTVNDLYAEERRDILVKLKLNSLPMAIPTAVPCLNVSMKYHNCLTAVGGSAEGVIEVARPAVACEQEIPDEIDKQRNRVETADAIEAVAALAKEGNFTAAQSAINKQHVKMKACKSRESAFTVGLMAECDDMLECVSGATAYRSHGWHSMAQAEQCHRAQRNKSYSNTCQQKQAAGANAYFGM